MSCGCKKKGTVNNLNSGEHVALAKQVYADIISVKTTDEYTDLDKLEIYSAYSSLYPNAKITPTLDNAIAEIKRGIDYYNTKLENKIGKRR